MMFLVKVHENVASQIYAAGKGILEDSSNNYELSGEESKREGKSHFRRIGFVLRAVLALTLTYEEMTQRH